MTINVAIYYTGKTSGTLQERRTFLTDCFNAISPLLQQHGVQVKSNGLSVTGQTIEASIDQSNVDQLKASLQGTLYQVVPNSSLHVTG